MRPWVGVALVFLVGALLRLPSFGRPLLSDDEAIYAATAGAMSRGEALYRDVVDHKPPVIYHLYQAGAALLGDGQAHGAHLLVLLAVLGTAALLWRLGGAIAAGLFLVFSTTWHDYDALAANCELFLLLPQTAAALWLLRVTERPGPIGRDLGRHLGIGALIGLAALCKYQGLTFLGVSAGVLAWGVLAGRWRPARAIAGLAVQIVGAALPAAGYLLWTTVEGSAQATLAWFAFNFSYVGAGLEGTLALRRALWRLALIGGVAIVPYGLGLAGAAAVVRDAGRALPASRAAVATLHPVRLLATLWLLTSAVALSAGGRFFGHYFHLVLPPLCLLAAPGFVGLWRRGRVWRAALATLCALPALVFFLLASWARPLAEAWDHRDPPYQQVVDRVWALSAPSDRLFVWGNSPQLYVLAGRPLGSRFTFCNYMTGESPGTPTETGAWNADRSSLAPAWDMLFQDLDQRQPLLFVDAAAAGWDGYDKFPIARYPRLAAYLAEHYTRVEVVAGVAIYRRRG